MEESQESMPMTFTPWILVGLVVALIYAAVNLHQNKAKDTTATNQYVDGKKPKINDTRDQYLRKNVVTRRIETSSSSGHSSGHSGGRGGSHTSSSGVSHGGGGHRR